MGKINAKVLTIEKYFEETVYLLSSVLPLNKSLNQICIFPTSGFRRKCSSVHLSLATGPSKVHVDLMSSRLMLKNPNRTDNKIYIFCISN